MATIDPRTRPKVLIVMEPLVGGTLRHLEHILARTAPREFDLHVAVSLRRDPSTHACFEGWQARGWAVHEVPMRRGVSPVRAMCSSEGAERTSWIDTSSCFSDTNAAHAVLIKNA